MRRKNNFEYLIKYQANGITNELQIKNNMLNPEKIENLLVRSTNWIGDAVMTTPAIRAIRQKFLRTPE
jgi:hypothetical protein